MKYKWAGKSAYTKAVEIYTELGDYKDSKTKKAELQQKKVDQDAFDKLEYAYEKCKNYGTSLSSDKASITVDAEDEYDFDSLKDVEIIISELGLPDSLYEEMVNTTALMGRQSETYDYYEVNWSYHPDNGLDCIFKYKK